MVTAESAVVIPVLLLVLAVVLSALSVGVDQLRCVDAARVGARSAARGDSTAKSTDLARASAPTGARVGVQVGGELAVVSVAVHRQVAWLVGVDVVSTATAPVEQ